MDYPTQMNDNDEIIDNKINDDSVDEKPQLDVLVIDNNISDLDYLKSRMKKAFDF